MNILLIGSGGRENALAYRLRKSESCSELYISPGNTGTELYGANVSIRDENESYLEFCNLHNIDLVVVGPELPLVNGLGNYLREKGIKVFGPDSGAAQIESSKSFSKKLMQKYNVPTAAYKEFNISEKNDVNAYLSSADYPLVIKADGLAAGKGVFILNNEQEALSAVDEIFLNKIFGDSGSRIIIEEFMEGEEASLFAVTDGTDYVLLPAAQDHKRIGDNDTGKNTGGMGSYAPAPLMNDELIKRTEDEIIKPVLKGMAEEGHKFIGCLYAGLMITTDGPKVVEFNCRFGDPETQVVMPLLDGDFAKLLFSAAAGKIDKNAVSYNGGSSVCIVAASKGYPDSYKCGYEINGIENSEDILVYHAGTKKVEGKLVTAGGRVLGVTSVLKTNDLNTAREKAYNAISKIFFTNIYYRKDIAAKGLKYLSLNKD